jgi:hypothetical protein
MLWAQLARARKLVAETTQSLEIERQAVIDLERNRMVPSTINRYRLVETLDIRRQFLLSECSRILRKVGRLTEPLKGNPPLPQSQRESQKGGFDANETTADHAEWSSGQREAASEGVAEAHGYCRRSPAEKRYQRSGTRPEEIVHKPTKDPIEEDPLHENPEGLSDIWENAYSGRMISPAERLLASGVTLDSFMQKENFAAFCYAVATAPIVSWFCGMSAGGIEEIDGSD